MTHRTYNNGRVIDFANANNFVIVNEIITSLILPPLQASSIPPHCSHSQHNSPQTRFVTRLLMTTNLQTEIKLESY